MRSIPVLMVLALGSIGCSQKIYAGPELPEVSPRDLRIPETRKPVNLEVACSFGEELLPQVGVLWSKAYRESVYGDFREKRCGQLSSVVQGVFSQYASLLPAENVDRLSIKLDVRSPGLTGLTLTMEAEFMPIGRPPLRREYKGTLYGWLLAPTGARPVEEVPFGGDVSGVSAHFRRAEERLVKDMALNLVRDLQQNGEL